MYYCKLDSVSEFACNFWSTCPTPLDLSHDIDALGNFSASDEFANLFQYKQLVFLS